MWGRHVYLYEDNAEAELGNYVAYIKQKERSEARRQAFEDCTRYWQEQVNGILTNVRLSDTEKLALIREIF